MHFYGASLPSLWYELRDVVLFWCGHGVRIFRVDNPHTKPIPFWQWMIREVNERYPDALFLAEAFTRPKMMRKLAKIGFQQSYTYFTWRNTKQELTEYITELMGEMGEYYRPNFFANTPDINPYYLQTSGPAGFVVRATLAATLSSVYGLYNGFEICEGTPIPGKEEYLDSEKYELKAWDMDRPGNIREHIRKLNRIRRDNPALWDFRNTIFLNAWNDNILAYARMTPAQATIACSCSSTSIRAAARNAPTRCRCGSSACPTTAPSRSRTFCKAAASPCAARRTASPSTPPSALSPSGASSRRRKAHDAWPSFSGEAQRRPEELGTRSCLLVTRWSGQAGP